VAKHEKRQKRSNVLKETPLEVRSVNMEALAERHSKYAQEFVPTRQSLLSRLKNWDDQESWRVFFETYWKLIYNAAARAGLKNAEAQDVVQETVISVMKSMPEFKYDPAKGTFRGWLLRLTQWRIVDQIRKRQREIESLDSRPDNSSETSEVESIVDTAIFTLEQSWDEEWEKNLIDAAIEKVKLKVDPKQYQIFDLYVVKDWPVLQVARILKVNPGRVYLAKHRVGKLIKDEVTRLRAKPI
jgi:RNA polymerase sigma factor (sigma-70 family)